jgi:hypothetical protein
MFEDFVGVCRALKATTTSESPSVLLKRLADSRPVPEGERRAREAAAVGAAA